MKRNINSIDSLYDHHPAKRPRLANPPRPPQKVTFINGKPVCRHFVRDVCRFDDCRFYHPTPDELREHNLGAFSARMPSTQARRPFNMSNGFSYQSDESILPGRTQSITKSRSTIPTIPSDPRRARRLAAKGQTGVALDPRRPRQSPDYNTSGSDERAPIVQPRPTDTHSLMNNTQTNQPSQNSIFSTQEEAGADDLTALLDMVRSDPTLNMELERVDDAPSTNETDSYLPVEMRDPSVADHYFQQPNTYPNDVSSQSQQSYGSGGVASGGVRDNFAVPSNPYSDIRARVARKQQQQKLHGDVRNTAGNGWRQSNSGGAARSASGGSTSYAYKSSNGSNSFNPAFATDPSSHPLYKTAMCRTITSGDRCMYGEKCKFAHSLEELRTVPEFDRPRIPKPCIQFARHGMCTHGVKCMYRHVKNGAPIS